MEKMSEKSKGKHKGSTEIDWSVLDEHWGEQYTEDYAKGKI